MDSMWYAQICRIKLAELSKSTKKMADRRMLQNNEDRIQNKTCILT